MRLSEINPYIRFAEEINYRSLSKTKVFVRDCRMFYILSGEGELIINNQTFKLEKKSLFFCRENSIYEIISDGLTLISLNFDLTQKKSGIISPMPPRPVCDDDFLKNSAEKITDCRFFDSYIFIDDGEEYLKSINNILLEYKMQKIYYLETSSSKLKDILIRLARNQTLPTKDSKNAVSETINYINMNFESELTNTNIAKTVGYHPYYLNRLFIKHTGQSIHRYVLTRRIEEAKRLLLNSTLTLSDISERVGFNSTSHFSSYFKQMAGISPHQYRIKFQRTI